MLKPEDKPWITPKTAERIEVLEDRLSGLDAMLRQLLERIDTARPSASPEKWQVTSIEERLSRIEAMLQSLLGRPIAPAVSRHRKDDDEELQGPILITGSELRELFGLGSNRFYATVRAERFDHLRSIAHRAVYVRDAALKWASENSEVHLRSRYFGRKTFKKR